LVAVVTDVLAPLPPVDALEGAIPPMPPLEAVEVVAGSVSASEPPRSSEQLAESKSTKRAKKTKCLIRRDCIMEGLRRTHVPDHGL